jgi:hypothetical protein
MRGALGPRPVLAVVLGAGLLFPAAGEAVVTIGSNLARAPTNGAPNDLSISQDALPAASQAAGGVTSPVNGTVTLWRVRSGPPAGGSFSVQVFRPLGGGLFTGAGTSALGTIPPNSITAFATQLPISIGDRIGTRNDLLYGGVSFNRTGAGTGDVSYWNPHLDDGGAGRAPSLQDSRELTINADIEPTNTFTVRVTGRNKKKGTATITANLPNPGELTASGKGVKAAGTATISKAAAAPGPVTLVIRAKGKKRAALNDIGKVKVKPKLTFTPTGGTAKTQSTKVKLKKNL